MKVIKVTKEVLMSTSVGLAVNKFRKSENEELRNLVKVCVLRVERACATSGHTHTCHLHTGTCDFLEEGDIGRSNPSKESEQT